MSDNCEYMTHFGCPARDFAKDLQLQAMTEGSEDYQELSDLCKKQCCMDCEKICGYRCGRC